jgi:putative zinc ribbon protein
MRKRKHKHTNSTIDQILISNNRKIIRLGSYVDCGRTKISWGCLVCDYVWQTVPDKIINGNRGCPRCGGKLRLSNEIVDQRLTELGLPIIRLGTYASMHSKIPWQCLIKECSHIWEAEPNSIIGNNTGCPKCSGKLPLTNELIDEKIFGRPIKRIGNYKWPNKIDFQCLKCELVWKAYVGNIIHREQNCPECSSLNEGEIIILSHIKELNINYKYDYDIRKINTNEKRYCRLDFYFPDHNYSIEYNGRQHYEPSMFISSHLFTKEEANQRLFKQQARDKYVNEFCKNNNIIPIWIDGRKYRKSGLKKCITTLMYSIINNEEIKDFNL